MYVILFSIGAENVYSSVWFFFSFTFFSFFWENASQSKHIQYLLFFWFFAQYFQATEFSISQIVIFSQDASNQSIIRQICMIFWWYFSKKSNSKILQISLIWVNFQQNIKRRLWLKITLCNLILIHLRLLTLL